LASLIDIDPLSIDFFEFYDVYEFMDDIIAAEDAYCPPKSE